MERFRLEKSAKKADWWVLTDTENLVVLQFKEHHFNDKQKASVLSGSIINGLSITEASALIARIMREMADYMRDSHYDIAL